MDAKVRHANSHTGVLNRTQHVRSRHQRLDGMHILTICSCTHEQHFAPTSSHPPHKQWLGYIAIFASCQYCPHTHLMRAPLTGAGPEPTTCEHTIHHACMVIYLPP